MEIILAHARSDFDALGATVAASKLFPQAVPVLQTVLEARVQEFVALHKDVLKLVNVGDIDLAAVTKVYAVDTARVDRLGAIGAKLDRPDVTWCVYDHHPPAPGDLPTGEGRHEVAGSATTLLVERLVELGIPVTPLEATAMALGIYVDTGNMTFPGTQPADARAVAFLLGCGADLAAIAGYTQYALDAAQQALFDGLVENHLPTTMGGLRVLLAHVALGTYIEGLALIAHKLVDLFHLDVVIVAVTMDKQRTRIVARGGTPAVDLLAWLAPFEPRGHAQAAMAVVRDRDAADIMAEVRAAAARWLPAEPVAADLMSSPVHGVGRDASLSEAAALLVRYGHTALAVVDDGHLVGIISRRDLDRAAHHGLGDVRVRAVMTQKAITVGPQATLSAIEALLVAHNIGRVPVVAPPRGQRADGAEAIVGIVTRSDILRVKYATGPARAAAVRAEHGDVARRMAGWWAPAWLAAMRDVAAVAGDRPVYLVGGAVRDMLLGTEDAVGSDVPDLDLVVEGDGIAVARAFAAAHPKTHVRAHAPFGTASLELADGRKLDIASARTEFYAYPAALPTVEFGSIKQDLTRRDFTVNCLAVRVDAAHFGELVDFFGSRRDLERRELRVLHNLSFVEDPTRILRALRFERQLGFTLEPESESYARFALGPGTFDGLGGERIKQEVKRILGRPDARAIAARMADLGAWRLVDPAINMDRAACVRLRALERFAKLGPGEDAWWLARLAAVVHDLDPLERAAALERLHLAGGDRDKLADAWASEAVLAAAEPGDVVTIHRALTVLPLPLVAFLATVVPRASRVYVARFLRDWRGLRPRVTGRDLAALGLPPGPRYGEILEAVWAARLTGAVDDPAAERALLERLARAPSVPGDQA